MKEILGPKDYFKGDIVATVLFLDIRNSLGISAKLEPSGTFEFIKTVMLPLIKCVEDHKGFLCQIQGDALLSVFGHEPESSKDHAMLAVECAMNMQKIVSKLNPVRVKDHLSPVFARIGICTGEMYATEMDVFKKIDYTVLGYKVNLASRLEKMNKDYNTNILIDDRSYAYIHKKVLARALDKVEIPGCEEKIPVYEVISKYGEHRPEDLHLKTCYEKGLSYFEQQDWQSAIRCFQQIAEDGASNYMIKRCRENQDRLSLNKNTAEQKR